MPSQVDARDPSPRPQEAQPEPAAESIVRLLDEARARTYELVAPLTDDDYRTVHHAVLGPIAWDLGHIGQQEDLWLVQTMGGRAETRPDFNRLYDAYRNPRPTRASLPLLGFDEVKEYHAAVRAAALSVLRDHEADPTDPLWRDHFGHKMIVLHEYQHNETILQHLQAIPDGRYTAPQRRLAPETAIPALATRYTLFAGGAFPMGVAPHTAWTYDNEWPRHEVEVGPFWLAEAPVTNRMFLAFVEAGGYSDDRWWDPAGHAFVAEQDVAHPLYWRQSDGRWTVRQMETTIPLPLDAPVMNVSWYEADAFARWAGVRLPTEAEWEYAATWDAAAGIKRVYPWGDAAPTSAHANLDQRRYGPDPVGSHPEGATSTGIHQMVGDVWEWCASDFQPYPGFEAFPYRDYSERFFGDEYRMLRGGSWATRPGLRLGTFRNWDYPIRRQIFAGLRLAADVDDAERPPRWDHSIGAGREGARDT